MKTYSINDIIPQSDNVADYYVGVFEDTEDPDIEWGHRHSYYSIVWFTHGNGINVIDFDEFEIKQNRVFTTKPREVHNWSHSIDSKGFIVMLEEHFAQQLNIDFQSPFIDLQENDVNFFKEIFHRIIKKNTTTQQETIAISYLCSLIDAKTPSQGNPNPLFTEFKQLITGNYKANYGVGQCAAILGISIDELNQVSKDATGLSPKQIQLELKMTEAKRLLLYTSLQASEIAYKIGFEDTSYFSRIFRNKTSLSPTLFREKYLNHSQKSLDYSRALSFLCKKNKNDEEDKH